MNDNNFVSNDEILFVMNNGYYKQSILDSIINFFTTSERNLYGKYDESHLKGNYMKNEFEVFSHKLKENTGSYNFHKIMCEPDIDEIIRHPDCIKIEEEYIETGRGIIDDFLNHEYLDVILL